MAAVLDDREQEILDGVKELYKELQRLSETSQETESQRRLLRLPPNFCGGPDEPKHFCLRLPNLVRPNDDHLQLLVTDAFAKSKWKKINMEIRDEESYQGDETNETTLCNSVFRGLSQNACVEEVKLVADYDTIPVSIPCLPPNLRRLELEYFDLSSDVENNRTGLPEVIQHHKHLNYLKLHRCELSPEALGVALCINESINHLAIEACCECSMKDFFDSVNNTTLQTLELLSSIGDYIDLGVSGIEAMNKALNDNRLALQKLGLVESIRNNNEANALARLLADYTMIKELDLSKNRYEKDFPLKAIMASLQRNTGLRSLKIIPHFSLGTRQLLKTAEIIKDFVKSRPDGTLERVVYLPQAQEDTAQEEIDTLLDINKLKPLICECNGVPLSVLQHKRLDCRYFYIRSRPDVCRVNDANVEEPPRKRQKTHHASTV